ncbi:hypothetical protein JCM16775_0982 [Leptotrichia hofstadii]|jgi:hypothetical protein|uniref:Uncharacterized protein n=2 Tax=Leptotrichia hofstadii TaxID=157688 RepID=C9MXJ3_9FUSO|nr:hypothetical protein [Leptotrichia hofstadii]EEX74602.1 hypothetical protein GCWU000323_01241 [Leptotrichia hofstadii F0254]BBM38274.1 hypothetical protein JCM16775_0982 [Leptotrichia hofstadii]
MKAKKLLLCGIMAVLAVPMMADSTQDVLRQARKEYYKSLNTSDAQPEVTREKLITIDEEGVVDESDRIKPKSPIEKLEYNAAKAMDRVDFYERVVRSVQREEKELGEFDSVLARDGVKKAKRVRKTAK